MNYRIDIPRTRGTTSTIAGVSVPEPRTTDELVATYEELCDQFGQTVGDNYLDVMEALARGRKLIDAKGRRTRKATR